MPVVRKEDAKNFQFHEYRKIGVTKISEEVLPVGTEVMTLEGVYVCSEPSRLAVDIHGNVYPIAESIFRGSYVPV